MNKRINERISRTKNTARNPFCPLTIVGYHTTCSAYRFVSPGSIRFCPGGIRMNEANKSMHKTTNRTLPKTKTSQHIITTKQCLLIGASREVSFEVQRKSREGMTPQWVPLSARHYEYIPFHCNSSMIRWVCKFANTVP